MHSVTGRLPTPRPRQLKAPAQMQSSERLQGQTDPLARQLCGMSSGIAVCLQRARPSSQLLHQDTDQDAARLR